jgi:hypothetical protein
MDKHPLYPPAGTSLDLPQLEQYLQQLPQTQGLRVSDLLNFPDPVCHLLTWAVRADSITAAACAEFLGCDPVQAASLLNILLSKAYLTQSNADQYQINLAQHHKPRVPSQIWQAIEGKPSK